MMINVAVLNPGGRGSSTGIAYSVDEGVGLGTDKLLQDAAAEGGFGQRNQPALKALVCIYLSWSHTILFMVMLSSVSNVMGYAAC